MITIAIIEDNEQFKTVLAATLGQNPELKVIGKYSSAEEAEEGMPSCPPDVAIVDIELKNISGVELIRNVKERMPNTQFLIFTAHQDNENVFNALRAGASGYLVKGASVDDIGREIVEVFNGGSPMSSYIARKVINLIHKQTNHNQYALTEREKQVLTLLSQGLLYKEISNTLGVATNTIKNHCKNIYVKMHVQNKVEAINKFRRN